MARATSTVPIEERLPDALPQVRYRLVLAAERWDQHIAELRRLVDRAEAYVREREWGWELGPIRELIDRIETRGRERIRLGVAALRRVAASKGRKKYGVAGVERRRDTGVNVDKRWTEELYGPP